MESVKMEHLIDVVKESKDGSDTILSAKEDAELIIKILKGRKKALAKLKKKYAKKIIESAIEKVAAKAGLAGSGPGILAAVAMEGVEVGNAVGKWIARTAIKANGWNLCVACYADDVQNKHPKGSWWTVKVNRKGTIGLCYKDKTHNENIYGVDKKVVKDIWDYLTFSDGEEVVEVRKCCDS
jgi:hypothetical protein